MSVPDPDATGAVEEETDEGFDDGFEGTKTPTEAPGPSADDATPPPPPAAPAAPAEPEYVQLTKAEAEELRARAALVPDLKATQERSFGTAFGKIGGIERDLQALKTGKRVEIKAETIEALKKDIPELAEALEQINGLQALGGGIDQAAIETMVQQRVAPALEQITTTVERKFEAKLLSRAHPDWSTVTKTPEFVTWAEAQPDDFKRTLATTWDSDFLGNAITTFKATRKAAATPPPSAPPAPDTSSTRRSRMSAAVTPRGSGTPPATDPEAEFDAGFATG